LPSKPRHDDRTQTSSPELRPAKTCRQEASVRSIGARRAQARDVDDRADHRAHRPSRRRGPCHDRSLDAAQRSRPARPINRLVNEAVAEYIESNADTLARKLEGTLAKLEGYRRRDPGFRKAIARFVEAEATLEDDTQGRVVEANAGPAVAMVRETLRGG
jgi:hypothetical protein